MHHPLPGRDKCPCHRGHHHDTGCRCCCHDREQDGEKLPRLSLRGIAPQLPEYMLDEYKQEQFLSLYPSNKDCRPNIVEFSPWSAVPSSLIVIIGHGFAPRRELNTVTVGGSKALVVTAERHRLVVICSFQVKNGPVHVKTHDGDATGPRDFKVLSWPRPTPEVDGPPYSFEGVGDGTQIDLMTRLSGNVNKPRDVPLPPIGALAVPALGTAKVLCVCGYPRDTPPTNPANSKTEVRRKCDNVTKYYKQASYNRLNVAIDVTDYFEMAGNRNLYYKDAKTAKDWNDGYPNLIMAVLPQIWAECAWHAINKLGFNLNNYDILMIVMHLGENSFVRGWGGGSQIGPNITFPSASPDQDALSINITLTKSLGQITLGSDADWGRFAHEISHNIVPPAGILSDDIYEGGFPGEDATGAPFDLMGDHDHHPLFSGYNIENLGWFTDNNVRVFNWSATPFSQEVDIVAHGMRQNINPSRCHLVRIQVSSGLQYYIEVRQKPGSTDQVFDTSLPVPDGKDGGVIVTRSINGTINNNESIKVITLLQASPTTLSKGEVAADPLRNILITVVDDNVQARPLVCKVKIEWAQRVAPSPRGTSDLWIKPWGPDSTTPDIWIDRIPYYPEQNYDHQDDMGNPVNGGDAPLRGEINHFSARIRNSGTSDASNVVTTFYAITPPGVGDSGNWTPLKTVTLSVQAGKDTVATADWNPRLDQHTSLQVAIVPQTGEISAGNNKAQSNVFTFFTPENSVANPIELPVAVRNPLKKRTLIWIALDGVPEGFYVYFPHRWLYLEALSEQILELLVIPLRESKDLKNNIANVRVRGYVPWHYNTPQKVNNLPASSTGRYIGGIKVIVSPRIGSKIFLQPNPKSDGSRVTVLGNVTPPTAAQTVRVDMSWVDRKRKDYLSVQTNAGGGFMATFTLAVETPQEVVVAFQAHIINATSLAPANSNIIHFVAKVNPSEPKNPKLS